MYSDQPSSATGLFVSMHVRSSAPLHCAAHSSACVPLSGPASQTLEPIVHARSLSRSFNTRTTAPWPRIARQRPSRAVCRAQSWRPKHLLTLFFRSSVEEPLSSPPCEGCVRQGAHRLDKFYCCGLGSTPTLPPRRHCLPSESSRARGCEMGTLLLCESLWGMLTARHRMRDIDHAGLNGRDKHIPKQDMILDCQ